MIKDERVKELFQLALYDQKDDTLRNQVKSYFKSDYVGKEIIKSFFLGTLAFIFIGALYVLYNAQSLLEKINSLDLVQVGTGTAIIYVVFMVVYMIKI